jgi:phenylacetate-CoA ligase
MSPDRLGAYVQNLCDFRPRFFSGFPSAISELARFIELQGVKLPFTLAAVFVTSETLTDDQREVIERVFGCKVRDQYCASEGAPFIVECPEGRLHLDITSGVVEVIDDDGNEADEGEMLVTAFFTKGTPIIRYRIGDSLVLSAAGGCPCGWETPLVSRIHGRTTDYIEAPGRGKVFCSQIGDCVKGVSTVIKFQVEMSDAGLQVYLVADRSAFEVRDKRTFLHKVHERMGDVPVAFHYVDDIPRTRSGKHTLVRKPSFQ